MGYVYFLIETILLPLPLVSSVILVQSTSLGLTFLISATMRPSIGSCGQELKEAAASVFRGHHHILISCLGVILASQMLSFCNNIKMLILFIICKLLREVKLYTIILAEPHYPFLFSLHWCSWKLYPFSCVSELLAPSFTTLLASYSQIQSVFSLWKFVPCALVISILLIYVMNFYSPLKSQMWLSM